MKPPNYAAVYAAALYPQLARIARSHGYALAVHGSLARDFDLICVPWVREPCEPMYVIESIERQMAVKWDRRKPDIKWHGRQRWVLNIGFGECYVDLQFILPNYL